MDPKILKEATLAYQAVYDEDLRAELEEQQAFENWVNSLVEEGYDLSEYTWEDMYEEYIEEMGTAGGNVPGSRTAAQNKAYNEKRMQANVARAQAPVAGTGRGSSGSLQRVAADKGAGGNAAYKAGGGDAAARSGLTRQQIQQKGMAATKAAAKPAPTPAAKPSPAAAKPAPTPAAKPTPAAAKPAATTPAASKPAPTAASKPPASKPTPTAAAKPAGSAMDQWAKANPRLAQAQKIRQQGGSRAEVNKSLYNKGTAAATSTPTVVKAGFDMFDIVKGYLLDEGYAETEQAAIAIMANMSEEWKFAIISEQQLDEVSRRDEFTRAAIARSSGRKGGITFEPGPNWDPSANRGKGAHISPKQKEKQRRKALRAEEYMDEAQVARNNPEKYEGEQAKKSAPVRGERTPMPPRGDKRREDFEKWYAKNVR